MLKKSLIDADRLIFAGMTCLVASLLLGIILVLSASYVPATTTVAAHSIIPIPVSSIPLSTRPVVVTPPLFTESSIYPIDLELADNPQHRQANAFCIQWTAGQRYLVSHASLLSRSDWQQMTRARLRGNDAKPLVPVELKLLFLGTFTEDHQPNLLMQPDLGLDLVVWSMPDTVKGLGLRLSSTSAVRDDDVWIVAIQNQNTNAQSHFHCRALECSENALSIQPFDRFPLDQIIGAPVVNQRGEVIGNVLGGNDLTLIGASSQGLIRRLESIKSKRR